MIAKALAITLMLISLAANAQVPLVQIDSDVAITFSASPTRNLRPGDPIEFTLTATNNGPNAVTVLPLFSANFRDQFRLSNAFADCLMGFLVADDGTPFSYIYYWLVTRDAPMQVGETRTCHLRLELSEQAPSLYAFYFGLLEGYADLTPDNNGQTVVLQRAAAPVPALSPWLLALLAVAFASVGMAASARNNKGRPFGDSVPNVLNSNRRRWEGHLLSRLYISRLSLGFTLPVTVNGSVPVPSLPSSGANLYDQPGAGSGAKATRRGKSVLRVSAIQAIFLVATLLTPVAADANVGLQSVTVDPPPPMSNELFLSIGPSSMPPTPHDEGAVVSWPVTVNLPLLSTLPLSVVVNFPNRKPALLKRGRYEARGPGAYLWTGDGNGCSGLFSAALSGFRAFLACGNGPYDVDKVPGSEALQLTYYDQSLVPPNDAGPASMPVPVPVRSPLLLFLLAVLISASAMLILRGTHRVGASCRTGP